MTHLQVILLLGQIRLSAVLLGPSGRSGHSGCQIICSHVTSSDQPLTGSDYITGQIILEVGSSWRSDYPAVWLCYMSDHPPWVRLTHRIFHTGGKIILQSDYATCQTILPGLRLSYRTDHTGGQIILPSVYTTCQINLLLGHNILQGQIHLDPRVEVRSSWMSDYCKHDHISSCRSLCYKSDHPEQHCRSDHPAQHCRSEHPAQHCRSDLPAQHCRTDHPAVVSEDLVQISWHMFS